MIKSNKLVRGIGIKGMKYPSRVDGVIVKEYQLWVDMLTRCSEIHCKRQPSYIGTTCSENFKSYSFFYEWCNNQVGFGNKDQNNSDWHLDKDLLIKGNKVYSEDTCVFVPSRVNNILLKHKAARGKYPIGVVVDKNNKTNNNFRARCCVEKGILKNIGSFNSAQTAFQAYKDFKEALIKQVAAEYKNHIDVRLYQALIKYQVEITD